MGRPRVPGAVCPSHGWSVCWCHLSDHALGVVAGSAHSGLSGQLPLEGSPWLGDAGRAWRDSGRVDSCRPQTSGDGTSQRERTRKRGVWHSPRWIDRRLQVSFPHRLGREQGDRELCLTRWHTRALVATLRKGWRLQPSVGAHPCPGARSWLFCGISALPWLEVTIPTLSCWPSRFQCESQVRSTVAETAQGPPEVLTVLSHGDFGTSLGSAQLVAAGRPRHTPSFPSRAFCGELGILGLCLVTSAAAPAQRAVAFGEGDLKAVKERVEPSSA